MISTAIPMAWTRSRHGDRGDLVVLAPNVVAGFIDRDLAAGTALMLSVDLRLVLVWASASTASKAQASPTARSVAQGL